MRNEYKISIIGCIIIIFIATMTIPNKLIIKYNGEYSLRDDTKHLIYDMGHNMTSKIGDMSINQCKLFKIITDNIIQTFSILFIIWIIFNNKINEYIDYYIIVSILFLLKRLFSLLTILPDPYKNECHKRNKKSSLGLCNDLFFSGHMIGICFYYYIFILKPLLQNKKNDNLNCLCATIYVLLYIYATINCQFHYTIDIIIAILLSLIGFIGFDMIKM